MSIYSSFRVPGQAAVPSTPISVKQGDIQKQISALCDFAEAMNAAIQAKLPEVSLFQSRNRSNDATCDRGYKTFAFPLEMWRDLVAASNYNLLFGGKSEGEIKDVVRRARLDLVEALAEFNIEPDHITGENPREIISHEPTNEYRELQAKRFLQGINCPEGYEELEVLLEDAKRTVKGDLFITNKADLSEAENPGYSIAHAFLKGRNSAPHHYVNVWLLNSENNNWVDHSYHRFTEMKEGGRERSALGEMVHIDHIRHIKEGERLIIPPSFTTEGMILRCNQEAYRYSRFGAFHDVIARFYPLMRAAS